MAPPQLPQWQPRRTLIDLYNERDAIPWYYRLLATFSALMLALGFIIFPSSYIQSQDFTTTQISALSSALAFIVFSFIISLILTVFLKSCIFHLDVLYFPHLLSSGIGLLSTAYYLATHPQTLDKSGSTARNAITALILSVLSILVFGIQSLLTFRKIYMVRARDARHRQTRPTNTSELLPESEQQRKQLLSLLLQQEEYQASIPDTQTAQTFKIDWPGNHSNSSDRSRRNTINTLRSFSRFGTSSRYASRRSSTFGMAQPDHLPGGVDRVPTMIREESTLTDSRGGTINQNHISNAVPLTAPRPAIFTPRAHSALFNTSGVDEGSRAPSYCEHAHPSMHIDVQLPQFQPPQVNGYPVEKIRPTASENPCFGSDIPAPCGEPESRRSEYFSAPSAGRGNSQDYLQSNSFAGKGDRMENIELADRGRGATGLGPEPDVWKDF